MTVKKAELARIIGVSKGRVTQYLARGLPEEPDGSIDLDRAKAWIAENVDPGRRAARHVSSFVAPAPALGRLAEAPAADARQDAALGFRLGVLAALTDAPIAVALAVAEAGEGRGLAEMIAERSQVHLWGLLNEAGASAGLLPLGGDPHAMEALDGWRERLAWGELFDAEGDSLIPDEGR